MIQEKNRDNK